MILQVNHKTIYSYDRPLQQSIQVLRLTPFNHHRQRVINWRVDAPNKMSHAIDWFGNQSSFLNLSSGEREINIVAHGLVEVYPAHVNPVLGTLPPAYYLRSTYLSMINADLIELAESCRVNNLVTLSGKDKLSLLFELSAKILQCVPYTRGVTTSATTAIAAYSIKAGVCQDHSHIFLACCRYLGIPARYVSGYLYTNDAAHLASHAWAEAWIESSWCSFDISNQCSAGENHIELAYGLDYLDACPVRGSRIGGGLESIDALSYVTANHI